MFEQSKLRLVGSGLRFPEGPVVEADGTILVCEVEGGALVRVSPDGARNVVADLGTGANGAAFGPDGAVYVGTNGGFRFETAADGNRSPVALADGNDGNSGAIWRVDATTGAFEALFTESDGHHLGSLNDLVFDAHGGAYLADTLAGRIHYFDPVAGTIHVATANVGGPNGLGLSPDGRRLYASETFTGRVRVWDVSGPGQLVEESDLFHHQKFGTEGAWFWDGLAVDGAGNVAVADLLASGVRVLSPDGRELGLLAMPEFDISVTCLCFGGPEGNTAYITSGGRGKLYAVDWPWPGLRLNFQP